MSELEKLLRQAAKEQEEDGFLEVDNNAEVSMSDSPEDEGGAYVAAWLWIPFTEEMYQARAAEKEQGATAKKEP